jgi:ATP-binding cassette subfamily C protein CydCD
MAGEVRWRILAAALIGLLAVAAGIARLAIAGVMIVQVVQGNASFSTLVMPLMVMAGLIGLRSLLQYWHEVFSHHTASIVKIKLRQRLYQHALALGPGHFDQSRTGDVLLLLADGVERMEAFFGRYLPQILVAALAPLLIFGFMAVLDLRIGLIFLGFALFTLVVPNLLHRWNRSSSLRRRNAYGALGADFLDSVQGMATLKAFGQSQARGQLLAGRSRHLYRSTMGVLAANGATTAITILGISAGAALALGWGAVRVTNGELELRTLLIVLMLGVEIFRPLRELVQLYHEGMIAMSSAEGIFALLDTPVEVKEPSRSGLASESGHQGQDGTPLAAGLRPEVRFEDVSFAYSQGKRPALRDVSFTLREGETLGLVGPSGAGKSTMVWLLLRFFDPQQGRILLGGCDLRDLPLHRLREQIAVVTQDTYLFHGSIADNLRFGKPDATQDELAGAARVANIHDFIAELPLGYDTVVGERGVRLSGGQKQRIAIARAVLKDAPILVLDEALSSVDAENESVIQQALDRLMEGRTTLIIAHRLSSVVKADRILVLDNGRLAESGSHRELVAAGGIYAQLMAHQQTAPEGNGLARAVHAGANGVPAPGEASPGAAPTGPATMPGGNHPVEEPARAWVPPAEARPLGILTAWGRLLALVKPWWGQLALTFVLGLGHHGTIIGSGVIGALLVGQVVTGGEIGTMLVLLGVFVLLVPLFTWAESWMAHDLAYRLLAEMRIDMYYKLEPLAPAYMVRRRSGDLVSIVGGDVETVEYFFAHTITPAFVAILVPSAVLVVLAMIYWPLALVLLPCLVSVAVSPFIAQKRSERLGTELRHQIGDVHSHMVDSIQGLREVSAFGQGPARTQEMVRNGWNYAQIQLRFLKERAFQVSFIEAMTALGSLAVLVTGIWFLLQGGITRPQLILAVVLSASAFAPISDIARTMKQLMETLAASRRVFAIHDEPVPVLDGAGVAERSAAAAAPPAIQFQELGFAYGPGEPQALKSVSFNAEPGNTVALVGRSGAGKTTCANLLMRFWDPNNGRILLDGHDLRDFGLDHLRQQIALVSQDTYLFNGSVRENLRLGKPEASGAELEEAARRANAHEFIMAFPDGYDTLVGERGIQLSGGQRQRISIARALLKNSPVLILDEATSHLDAVNEQQVREALERLIEGRTTLVIAHRLSTIRDADQIVVLDLGQVVEQGNHQELLGRQGLYAQLVSTQLVGATSGAEMSHIHGPANGHGVTSDIGMPGHGHQHH